MSLSVPVPLIVQDAGFLFWAPLLSAEPTHAAAGSTYDADTWPAAWIPQGATEAGTDFSYEIKVEPVKVAEFYDPIKWSTVERAGSISFVLTNYTLKQLQRSWNGGTLSTVSGSGATLSSKLLPVNVGTETRAMIGWESQDHTLRIVCYQALNSGPIKSTFDKAPTKGLIPCMFNLEVPAGAPIQPFAVYGAGVGRLGV
jgi:hypothetical protein